MAVGVVAVMTDGIRGCSSDDKRYKWHMGQKLQDGKKVLEMSVTTLHSKCRPIQTIHPTDLGLLPSWISISRPPAQEFSPSWNAMCHVQEGLQFPEIPGNLYVQKHVRKTA